ncbi:MAG: hypothetical protein ABWZ40_09925 [Caulobacterales bacterium]
MYSPDHVWRIDADLRALRPQAVAVLDMANEQAWRVIPPMLLEMLRLRVGALIGNTAGLLRRSNTARGQGLSEAKIEQLADYYKSDVFSDHEKRCLTFAEQFVIDVTGVTEADLHGLGQFAEPHLLHEFVAALYVTECTQRLEIMAPILLGGVGAASRQTNEFAPAGDASEGLAATLERYQETVVLGADLDPVVTEMVRLRCARTHDCRICKTLRLTDARALGVDDAMTAKIDFYEHTDLDERIKIALRVVDAFITRPDMLAPAVIDDARSAFTPTALAELCLDITKWSVQKIYVAQRSDAADFLPKNDQGLSFFSFDNDGRVAGFSA